MNKLISITAVIIAIATSWALPARAQDSADKAVPVEFFACNWRDGKGMADLDKVIEKFRKYADANDSDYTAWVLTPQFHNDEQGGGFDVGWLGSWPDGNAFGKSQDNWMSAGRDIAAAFDAVIDCGSRHELASSVVINAPDGPPDNGVVMFYACTLADGKSAMDAVQAGKQLAGAMKALGADSASWLFFPGIGAGDIDFDFWRVVAFPNYAGLGAAAEVYLNGGGWQKSREILRPVASCSAPAAFDARLARQGAGR